MTADAGRAGALEGTADMAAITRDVRVRTVELEAGAEMIVWFLRIHVATQG